MAKQYIWEKEIKEIQNTKVFFEDGSEGVFTEKQLEYVITDEPKDATDYRDLCLSRLCKDLLQVIEDHDLRKGDFQAMIQVLGDSYNESFLTAVGKAFWTYEEGRHSANFQDDIRVSDIKRLLTA